MKVLILGAMGMAGHTIAFYFKEQGHEVTAFATKVSPHFHSIVGNAFETGKLKEVLLGENYDLVINCIGLLNRTAEENPSKAVFLNSFLPHFIADILRARTTRFFHMSTDCVFAGNTGPYMEESFPDGRTFYDRSKALGEVNDSKNLTFRNSIIGPDIKEDGIGLFNWFMKQRGSIQGYTGAIWTGVTTLTLAKAMEQAMKEELTGLFNLVNNSSINKYELLILFNKYFRGNALEIKANDHLKLDKTLLTSRLGQFSFEVPGYEQMILEMKDWVYNHTFLYPSYYYNY